MPHRVVFIQGGGVGPDQEAAVRRVLAAAGVAIDWQVFPAGGAALEAGRDPLGPALLHAVRETGVALKTKLFPPREGAKVNFTLRLRRELGLFVSVRPIRNLAGLPARFDGLDILLAREITEDLYSAIEHEVVPG